MKAFPLLYIFLFPLFPNFKDKPGPATISYEPKQVVKEEKLTITCSVLDSGRPGIAGYKWTRDQQWLLDEKKYTLEIESANLETQANFTCLAYNEAGEGDPATIFVDVAGEGEGDEKNY